MKVLFINNDGAGFADHVDIEGGTTVASFFSSHMPYGKPADHLIRVNRLPVDAEYVLQEGDRITITPTKIHGAVSARVAS